MASSDSEGFESADEGHNTTEKIPRKHRKSSSNYGDCSLETAAEAPKSGVKEVKSTDGWGDFDIEEPEWSEPVVKSDEGVKLGGDGKKADPKTKATGEASEQGWDDFDDWGDEGTIQTNQETNITNKMASTSITNQRQNSRTEQRTNVGTTSPKTSTSGPNNTASGANNSTSGPNNSTSGPINSTSGPNDSKSGPNDSTSGPNNTLSGAIESASGSSWGWSGWGMDSLLSQATAGITSLTNQVSAGITTVFESGIGVPDPEELARRPDNASRSSKSNNEQINDEVMMKSDEELKKCDEDYGDREGLPTGDGDAFPFGSILKMVGSTGSKVLAGGLDTLETIGRKTMEVLQEGDPGLAKKRAMMGLDNNRPVLSVLLREAAARADEEDRVKDHQQEAREVHYENLFDDYEGLVHLEALEMLSRQVSLRMEERLHAASSDDRQEMRETMAQVEELCEIPDDEEDPDGDTDLLDRLQNATEDLGVKLQFQPLVKQYSDIQQFLKEDNLTSKQVYKRAISTLAQATALSMEIYHKVAEMLLVKPRRSTADEADSLTQMTVVLTKHMGELARTFTEKLNATLTAEQKGQDGGEKMAGKENVNSLVTNVFLEAGNSSTYLQNALVLELPIIQIGAFGKV